MYTGTRGAGLIIDREGRRLSDDKCGYVSIEEERKVESWARVGVAVEVGDDGADLPSECFRCGCGEENAAIGGEAGRSRERKETGDVDARK